MSDERAFLFDKLVNVLHEDLPAVVHQQVQIDSLPPIEWMDILFLKNISFLSQHRSGHVQEKQLKTKIKTKCF
jgi:hypothetical protein